MAEYERPDHIRQGHLFDPAVVRRELWQLLLIFLADRPLMALVEKEARGGQTLDGLHNEFCEDEITRILMNSAITLRVLDDRDSGTLQRVEPCGELQTRGQTEALTFREACNKIVHATRVNFDIERLDGRPLDRPSTEPTFMNPKIYLYGVRQGAEWRAMLDVIAYVHGAIQVV